MPTLDGQTRTLTYGLPESKRMVKIMILNPAELESIIPRRKKSGKEVDDYWQIWMFALPLSMRDKTEGWKNKVERLKKYSRDAKHKNLLTTKTADGIMKKVYEDISKQSEIEKSNFDVLRDKGISLKWSDVIPSSWHDEFVQRQAELILFYEDMVTQASKKSEKSGEILFRSLEIHIPFSQEIAKLSEYERANRMAGGKILRLLCTIDFVIHDPVIARASKQEKKRHFILDALPTRDKNDDKKTPERRFLILLKEGIKAGKFASVWKELKQKDTVKNWIGGRYHPSQERLLELLIDITDKVKEQIETSPDIVKWEDLSSKEVREEAENVAVEEFILLYKVLELTILLDAIFKQLEIYTGSRIDAWELLNQQVQFSLQKCNGSNL
jgi:hypothetical protein